MTCERRERDFVHVRSIDGEESLSLRFVLKGKEHHLLRSKREPVGKALKRVVTTLSKTGKGKKKPLLDALDVTNHVSVEAHMYTSELEDKREISPETTNQEAWVSGNTFVVNDTIFAIALNTPAVKSLRLPGCILTGCAAVPLVEMEFATAEQCRWVWRRCDSDVLLPGLGPVFPPEPEAAATSRGEQSLSSICREAILACPVVSTSFVYWSTDKDAHHFLILECIPRNSNGEEGQSVVVTSTNSVLNILSIPIAERHLLTPSHLPEPDKFRVVSYNILSNVYATSEHAQQTLYPYCDTHALDQDYRQSLIVRELLGYHADIISLQEVGAKCYSQFLSPALHHWGYEGCFYPKAGKTPEGEAIFFNRCKFSLVSEEAVVLREFVQQSPSCVDFLALHPLILNNLLKRHNILQTAFLQSTECPNRYLLVANTHLYFHPMGDHIRLLQVAISLKYLENQLETFRQKARKDAHIAVIFCGDFNSCPCTGAYSYMLTGSISRSHPDWQVYGMTEPLQCSCNHRALNVIHEDNNYYLLEAHTSASTGQESNIGLDLKHSLRFSNTCGTRYATNITLGWTGVIDYIFVDSDFLDTQRVIPLPPAEQLTEHVALPSINFPSDHVALVVDLIWRTLWVTSFKL